MQEEVTERYLEIREVETNRVITIIELLSPTNKSTREGRDEYDTKRMKVLRSMTHLVEIDLLRGGQPPAFKVQQGSGESDYRIVISRAFGRPTANVYLFSVRQPIPDVPIPLKRNEDEPILPLNQLIHQLYERARYDLIVDYQQPADPPRRPLVPPGIAVCRCGVGSERSPAPTPA